jgi:hypothetical protein
MRLLSDESAVRSFKVVVDGSNSCDPFPSCYYFYYQPGLLILDTEQIVRVPSSRW